ncbi:MAG: hypothetical protein V4683_00245 [Bacteroidota bacterium]
MIKFFGGPIAGFLTGIPIQKTIFLSAGGMMTAVIITTIFAKGITNYLDKRAKTKKIIFTRSARFKVKIWQKLGLFGIALLTPPLFTPIGGTLMALSFKVNVFKMVGYMLVSSLFWGYVVSWAIYKLVFISDWLLK